MSNHPVLYKRRKFQLSKKIFRILSMFLFYLFSFLISFRLRKISFRFFLCLVRVPLFLLTLSLNFLDFLLQETICTCVSSIRFWVPSFSFWSSRFIPDLRKSFLFLSRECLYFRFNLPRFTFCWWSIVSYSVFLCTSFLFLIHLYFKFFEVSSINYTFCQFQSVLFLLVLQVFFFFFSF